MNPSFVIAAFLISSVVGHSVMTSIIVNGVVQTSCLRPYPSSKYDYPISDKTNPSGLQSSAMTCGWPGEKPYAASKCSVPAGSTVSFQWHYVNDLSDTAAVNADTYYIDPSHKGPCLAYMARSDNGTGPVWFKIYENGYDASTKQFCVDKLRANNGLFTVQIPSDLAPGNYLIRAELIALHEAFQVGGAQPYVHCAEFTITGSGTSIPSTNLVSIPGVYTATEPGIYFDIYDGFKIYPTVGPPLYVAGSSSSSSSSTTGVTPATNGSTPATTGKAPANTGNAPATTGRIVKSTTGRVASPPTYPTPSTTAPASTSSSTNGACSNEGYMICSSSSSYQTCSHKMWSDPRACQAGTKCSPSGNYIYCV